MDSEHIMKLLAEKLASAENSKDYYQRIYREADNRVDLLKELISEFEAPADDN